MISKRSVCVGVCVIVACVLASAARASAEVRNFELSQVSGNWRCDARQHDDAAEPGRVVVVVIAPATATLTDWALAFPKKDGATGMEKLAGTPLTASVAVSDLKPDGALSLKGRVAGAAVEVKCPDFLAAGAPAPAASPQTPGAATRADVTRDQQARVWFASAEGKTAAETLIRDLKNRLQLKDVVLLPHLPSGAMASPYPASVAETTDLQIAVIIDANESKLRVPRVTTVACPDRDAFRILGTFEGLIGKGQAGERPPKFVLLPFEQVLQCGAGDVKYTLQMNIDGTPSGDPVEAHVKLRPVYQLAATAAVGFDSANLPKFAAVDGKVAESRTRVGSKLYVGFIWYPTGIDYDHVTRRNVVSPFLFFDPSAIQDNFIAGAAFTVKGRISIPIGLSVHKVPVPKGLKVGDPFTGEGDVPTDPDWRKQGLGVFVGVAFNVAEFLRVKNLVTPPKS